MRVLLFFSLGFALVLLAASRLPGQTPASTPVTIGDGIEYIRLQDLAGNFGELAEGVEAQATIVDLRFVSSDPAGASRLSGLLARRTGAVIVLINHATAGPIEAALEARQTAGDVLLVGTPTAGLAVEPGLLVETTPKLDEAAYAAFNAGTAAADLLDASIDKPRFDEARLLQRHVETNGSTHPPSPPSRSPTPEGETSENAGDDDAAPVRDRILQRAVNTILAARALGHL